MNRTKKTQELKTDESEKQVPASKKMDNGRPEMTTKQKIREAVVCVIIIIACLIYYYLKK